MTDETQHSKMTALKLVFPPVNNRFAYSLKDADVFEHYVRKSDFYMLGMKPIWMLGNWRDIDNQGNVTFDIIENKKIIDTGTVNISKITLTLLDQNNDLEDGKYTVKTQLTKKGIFFIKEDDDHTLEVLTPENILWHKSNRTRYFQAITGFENYDKILNVDLLYVGIAKVGDTYDRLISKGHKIRMEIPAAKMPIVAGEDISEELTLFFFKTESFYISQFGLDEEEFETPIIERKNVVADCEKAFVSILKPEFNSVIFQNYPQGADGLYNTNLARYVYYIGEDIKFNLPLSNQSIQGGFNNMTGLPRQTTDSIFVDRTTDQVTLHKA